jgi:hypothetical protein
MKAAVDDMDAYVDALIESFDASKISPCRAQCPGLGVTFAT